VINIGFLLYWLLFLIFAKALVIRMQQRFFDLDAATIERIHYSLMGGYKLATICFFIAPYCALLIIR
jgi:hypothetical protein